MLLASQVSTWQGYISYTKLVGLLSLALHLSVNKTCRLALNFKEEIKIKTLTTSRKRHFPFALMRGKGSTKTFAFFYSLPPCI